MGCIRAIIRLFIFGLIIWAIIHFGALAFMKEKYHQYTNPPREILIQDEKDFGNLSKVPLNYKLSRSLAIGNHKKITAEDIATGQKITLIDTGDTELIKQNDFYNKDIDRKINELLNSYKNNLLAPDKIIITQRGTILTNGKIIPYVDFTGGLKNIPFISISGTLAAYSTTNVSNDAFSKIEEMVISKNKTTTKIIFSIAASNKYKDNVTKKLIKSLSFK